MKKIITFILLLFVVNVSAQWAFRLPSIISNHAVFQQSTDVKLWGWGQSGSTVKIICSWNPADTVKAEPQKDWSWIAFVRTPKAGGPYTITFISSTQKVVINDIMIGEVWLCSGQSNMEYAFNWQAGVMDAPDEVAKSANNELRFFQLAHSYSIFPVENSDGEWKVSSPESTPSMSVAGYFFGKKLNQTLKVPVGLIASYWGGTCVQSWTPSEVFEKDQQLKKDAENLSPVNWAPVSPSILYKSMIYPLINYKIAGTIWYQGEANTEHPELYGNLFEALIKSWRTAFQTDFPFYFVQIAPWNGYWQTSGALLREQQAKALELPGTGMISVGDLVNDISDIHPKIKKEVGLRLANLALTEKYHVKGLHPYFPQITDYNVKKNQVVLHVKSLSKLTCKAKTPANFQLAGADKKFYPATAKLQKDGSLVLTSKEVKTPVAARYCFTSDGVPDLFDSNGLPLLPYRTDNW